MNKFISDQVEAVWEIHLLTIIKQRDPFLQVNSKRADGSTSWKQALAAQEDGRWPQPQARRPNALRQKNLASIKPVEVFPEKSRRKRRSVTLIKSKKKPVEPSSKKVPKEEVDDPLHASNEGRILT